VYARWLAEATGVDVFRLNDLRVSLPRQYRTGVSGSFTHPGKIQKKTGRVFQNQNCIGPKEQEIIESNLPPKGQGRLLLFLCPEPMPIENETGKIRCS
jgi:hypothetical protein